MIDIKHGRLTTTVSYFDGEVASEKKQVEMSLFSSKETILKDVIDALSLISRGDTTKLEMEVIVDQQGRLRFVKKWLV